VNIESDMDENSSGTFRDILTVESGSMEACCRQRDWQVTGQSHEHTKGVDGEHQ